MKYSLSRYKKRTTNETGERDCVFTCVYLCVKRGRWGPHHLLHRSTDKTLGLNIWHLLTKAAAAVASSSPCFFSSSAIPHSFSFSPPEVIRVPLFIRSPHLSLLLHLSFPHFPFVPSTQIKKLMRDRFFTNCPRNVYHWWNYNVGPAVLFISQLGEVLLDLMGSRHTEYI